MDIRYTAAAATQGYSATKALVPPAPSPPQTPDGGANALSRSVQSFEQTLQQSEDIAQKVMTTGADPHALVQALAQTEFAVEAAVTVRDRVVEAYQEILRMPV